MSIVGFNFTKMVAEKTGNLVGKVSINNNLSITDVKEIDVNMGTGSSKGLLIKFHYSTSYDPGVGKVSFEGDVAVIESAEMVKKCVESWAKTKTMDKALTQAVLSHILTKSTLQAIVVSRDLSLPAPVPLPKISQDVGGVAAAKPAKEPAKETPKKK